MANHETGNDANATLCFVPLAKTEASPSPNPNPNLTLTLTLT